VDPTGHAPEETWAVQKARNDAFNQWLDAVNAGRDWANYAADQRAEAAMIKNQMIKEGIELPPVVVANTLANFYSWRSVVLTQGLNYLFKKAETGSFTGDKSFMEDLRDVFYAGTYTAGQDVISELGKWDRSKGGGALDAAMSYALHGAGVGYLSIKGAEQSNTKVNPYTTYFAATASGPIADKLGVNRKATSKVIQGMGNLGMYIKGKGFGAVLHNLFLKDAYGDPFRAEEYQDAYEKGELSWQK
jgi:hypothetical protein